MRLQHRLCRNKWYMRPPARQPRRNGLRFHLHTLFLELAGLTTAMTVTSQCTCEFLVGLICHSLTSGAQPLPCLVGCASVLAFQCIHTRTHSRNTRPWLSTKTPAFVLDSACIPRRIMSSEQCVFACQCAQFGILFGFSNRKCGSALSINTCQSPPRVQWERHAHCSCRQGS